MRVLVLTGKGGVGTTTAAAATAVHAARGGTKTLLLSAAPVHPLLEAEDAAAGEPVEAEAGLVVQRTSRAAHLGSAAALGELLDTVLAALGLDAVTTAEIGGLPGVQEAVRTALHLRDAVSQGPWDLVVVDAGELTGALQLLAVPEALERSLARLSGPDGVLARLVRSGAARAAATRAGNGRSAGPGGARRPPSSPAAVLEAVRRLRDQLGEVRDVLGAPGTTVRLVLTPSPAVVAQSLGALTALAVHGGRVDGVVANGVVPRGGGDSWRRAVAAEQAEVLDRLAAHVSPLPVRAVPHLPGEPRGATALAGLGAAMLDGPGVDLVPPSDLPATVQVHRSGTGFVLEVAVPGARRADCALGRRGDDLHLEVAGVQRVLTLPSALRRCTVEGATLRDGRLRVRFTPDPALWRPL